MDSGFMNTEEIEPLGSMYHHAQRRERISYVPSSDEVEITSDRDDDTAQNLYKIRTQIQTFRKRFYSEASDTEWEDWHWQIRHRITNRRDLERIIRLTGRERDAFHDKGNLLPFAITPYYAALIDSDNPSHALRRAVIPDINEYMKSLGESEDPLKEEDDSPVPGLVHRYPDRVLFLVTDYCSTYCRYCTRSRMVGQHNTQKFTLERWSRIIEYISSRSEIRDVLLSGGDPLTLSDARLEWLLSALRKISHVDIIRIGTKVPVVLPQRITLKLTRMLKRYHPLWMSIHFTHPDELTETVHAACARLADAGIPLQSQTVLLAGVNDDVEIMRRLIHGLVRMRVRPYYLYQCDPIIGSAHFRTSIQRGLDIIGKLRGYTTGFAVPLYVIDAPGGGGKIPVMPEYVIGRDGDNIVMKNYEGKVYRYFDPIGRQDYDRMIN